MIEPKYIELKQTTDNLIPLTYENNEKEIEFCEANNIYAENDISNAESIKEVKNIISKWSNEIPEHDLIDLGQKIDLLRAIEKPTYKVSLQILCEKRALCKGIMPYKGQNIPPKSLAEDSIIDIWNLTTPMIDNFEEKEDKYIISHSQEVQECRECKGRGEVYCYSCKGARVQRCLKCSGRGEVRCSHCRGSGEDRCYNCSGSGQVDEYVGNGRYRKVNCSHCGGRGFIPCTECRNGWKNCEHCGGKGEIICEICNGRSMLTCSLCEGEKRIISFLYLHNTFKPFTIAEQIINSPLLPKEIRPDNSIRIYQPDEIELQVNSLKDISDEELIDLYMTKEEDIKETSNKEAVSNAMRKRGLLNSEDILLYKFLESLENLDKKVDEIMVAFTKSCIFLQKWKIERAIEEIKKAPLAQDNELGLKLITGYIDKLSGRGDEKLIEIKGLLNRVSTNDASRFIDAQIKMFETAYLNGLNFSKIKNMFNIVKETYDTSTNSGQRVFEIVKRQISQDSIESLKNNPNLKAEVSSLLNSFSGNNASVQSGTDYHIRKQRLTIELINNNIEVIYKHMNKQYSLWIYEDNNKVFAPVNPIIDSYFLQAQNLYESKNYYLARHIIVNMLRMSPENKEAKELKSTIIDEMTKIDKKNGQMLTIIAVICFIVLVIAGYYVWLGK